MKLTEQRVWRRTVLIRCWCESLVVAALSGLAEELRVQLVLESLSLQKHRTGRFLRSLGANWESGQCGFCSSVTFFHLPISIYVPRERGQRNGEALDFSLSLPCSQTISLLKDQVKKGMLGVPHYRLVRMKRDPQSLPSASFSLGPTARLQSATSSCLFPPCFRNHLP